MTQPKSLNPSVVLENPVCRCGFRVEGQCAEGAGCPRCGAQLWVDGLAGGEAGASSSPAPAPVGLTVPEAAAFVSEVETFSELEELERAELEAKARKGVLAAISARRAELEGGEEK